MLQKVLQLLTLTLLALPHTATAISRDGYSKNPADLKRATLEVKELMARSSISSKVTYCAVDIFTCRTFFYLKDKTTGAALPAFYTVITSHERLVAAVDFYIPVKDGKNFGGLYKHYNDPRLVSPADIEVKEILPHVEVVGQFGEIATIDNMWLPRLGTTQYIIGRFTLTSDEHTIVGSVYEGEDLSTPISPYKNTYLFER